MSYDRALRPSIVKAVQKLLQNEISRAFGLWIAAAIICFIMSFAWMSAHYDPNRAAWAAAKHETVEPALGTMNAP